jgi:hypothetical protein
VGKHKKGSTEESKYVMKNMRKTTSYKKIDIPKGTNTKDNGE